MEYDITTIGAEFAEKFEMDMDQIKNEVEYKISINMLETLKCKGIINDMEYAQIDKLNRQSFPPVLNEVYV